MSRSNFPQSDADRIAVAVTMAAVAAIVWMIVAFSPNPRDVSVAAVHTLAARHIDGGSRAAARETVSPCVCTKPRQIDRTHLIRVRSGEWSVAQAHSEEKNLLPPHARNLTRRTRAFFELLFPQRKLQQA